MTLLVAAAASRAATAGTVNDWVCPAYLSDDRQPSWSTRPWSTCVITISAIVLGRRRGLPAGPARPALPRLETAIVGVSTALYTVPSLALFPLLVPFTGLTATTVVIGLALYALTILVRSILDGLRSVPDDVRESATRPGLRPRPSCCRVELPLALPVMMAGLRVATVSTVALTTVGALVAYGGLGNLIADGVLTDFRAELFAACLLCVVLAVLLDVLIVGRSGCSTPWTRTRVRA